ncbi:MAG: CBS domain-containing protein [Oligoflexia bacterium]|nr:CBS domain-containing protein [Oligoflexia bacterium]
MKKVLMPHHSRLWTVRADAPIQSCIQILQENSIGALIVLSDNIKEEIVGIFTERDVVKNLALIKEGSFWSKPVRTVMTTKVLTLELKDLAKAPLLMTTHNIRHIPIVANAKSKKLIGVISQRDIFKYVMEQYKYDLDKIFQVKDVKPLRKKKVLGAFSADSSFIKVLEKGAQLSKSILVHNSEIAQVDLDSIEEIVDRFDSLLIDLDFVSQETAHKIISVSKQKKKDHLLYLVFNPILLDEKMKNEVVLFANRRRVHLFSKPIALGLLYARLFNELR